LGRNPENHEEALASPGLRFWGHPLKYNSHRLAENELPFDIIFALLSKNKVNYLALELNQQPKLEDCQNNLMKSIEFLKKNY
jgi:hypothetical protein